MFLSFVVVFICCCYWNRCSFAGTVMSLKKFRCWLCQRLLRFETVIPHSGTVGHIPKINHHIIPLNSFHKKYLFTYCIQLFLRLLTNETKEVIIPWLKLNNLKRIGVNKLIHFCYKNLQWMKAQNDIEIKICSNSWKSTFTLPYVGVTR